MQNTTKTTTIDQIDQIIASDVENASKDRHANCEIYVRKTPIEIDPETPEGSPPLDIIERSLPENRHPKKVFVKIDYKSGWTKVGHGPVSEMSGASQDVYDGRAAKIAFGGDFWCESIEKILDTPQVQHLISIIKNGYSESICRRTANLRGDLTLEALAAMAHVESLIDKYGKKVDSEDAYDLREGGHLSEILPLEDLAEIALDSGLKKAAAEANFAADDWLEENGFVYWIGSDLSDADFEQYLPDILADADVLDDDGYESLIDQQ